MVARSLLTAVLGGVVVVGTALANPASASRTVPFGQNQGIPIATRIAATTATYNAIEAKVEARQSLRLRDAADATAQEDIIDYGVNGLWQQGIDGYGVTVAYVVTNPDPDITPEGQHQHVRR